MSVLGVRLADLLARLPLDTVETFFEAHVDPIQGALLKHSDCLKVRAAEAMSKMRTPAGQGLVGDLDWGMRTFKLRVCMLILQPRPVTDPRSS